MDLITTYFNPCGYANLRRNYWRFRKALGRPLTTVELSFDGRFEIPDAIHVRGNDRNLMWQKERLVNVGLQHCCADKYAWVDADLIFEDPHWIEKATAILDDRPVCQLFGRITFLDEDGQPYRARPSWVANRQYDLGVRTTAPGGAWAARRDFLPSVPFDYQVLGGADSMLCFAFYGQFQDWYLEQLTPEWRRQYLAEATALHRRCEGKIGLVDQHVTHLYHGSPQNRQYASRHQILIDNQFDPARDVRISRNGLWEWASDKPDLHRRVRRYFEDRREDDPSEPKTKNGRKKHVLGCQATWGVMPVIYGWDGASEIGALHRQALALAEA